MINNPNSAFIFFSSFNNSDEFHFYISVLMSENVLEIILNFLTKYFSPRQIRRTNNQNILKWEELSCPSSKLIILFYGEYHLYLKKYI